MNSGEQSHIDIESKPRRVETTEDQHHKEGLREEHTLMRQLQNRMLDQLNQETTSQSMKHLFETLLACCRDLRR